MCAHTYRWPAVYAYAYVFIRICWLLINYTATWICICYVGSYPPLVKNRPNQSDTIIDYVWWRIIVCVHTYVLACYALQVFTSVHVYLFGIRMWRIAVRVHTYVFAYYVVPLVASLAVYACAYAPIMTIIMY